MDTSLQAAGTGRMTGDPDLGYGNEQIAGWIYNILPFIEQRSLHDMGAG